MKIEIKVMINNDDPIGALDYAARTISVDKYDSNECDYYLYMLSKGYITKQEAINRFKGHIGHSLSKICYSRFDWSSYGSSTDAGG